MVLTFLIGIVPPLRVAWYVSAGVAALLLIYTSLLVYIKNQAAVARAERANAIRRPQRPKPVRPRYVADGPSGWPRQTFNGLGQLGEGDHVHVVVKPAAEGAGA